MKAVIATDSISLRSRKMLLTFECPQDILINRSRHNHIWDNFADNSNIFAMPVEFFSGNHADFL